MSSTTITTFGTVLRARSSWARRNDCGSDLLLLIAARLSSGDLVLVRESAEDLLPADPVLGEVDLLRPGADLGRGDLVKGTVRPGSARWRYGSSLVLAGTPAARHAQPGDRQVGSALPAARRDRDEQHLLLLRVVDRICSQQQPGSRAAGAARRAAFVFIRRAQRAAESG